VNKPRPLIISRPELQSPLRRILAFALTLAAWVVWTLLLIPVLWMTAGRFGLHIPALKYFARIDSEKFDLILNFLPWAFLMILGGLGVVLVNGMFVKLLRAKRKAPTMNNDLNRIVMDVNADPAKFAMWHSARILQVEHGVHGLVKKVHVLLPSDGKR
jgi:poly-beta-1,6-N-acetyl-D-glucosamine biosynthesis protein PgaD